jgi:putative addiction module component (TIGR02574 family)
MIHRLERITMVTDEKSLPMSERMVELGIDMLSLDDRIALAEEICASVERDLEQSPLTDAQRRELERRLADSIARPDAAGLWEEVKARALDRAGR